MEAIARARYQRMSPRKIAQILDLIRGKPVSKAYQILQFIPKGGKLLIEKTLRSAVSNAGKNISPENLFVETAFVTPGPALKRFRAGPMGRAMPYKRRTCHLTIMVSDKKERIWDKKSPQKQ